MPQKRGEYASFHPEPAQNPLDSLSWTYIRVGPSSRSNGNMDTATLEFGRKYLAGEAVISKVSENGKRTSKRDVNGCPL